MLELGVRQIFARSPKARAGWSVWQRRFRTGRLPSCGLAGAASGGQPNALLRPFLPRFNAQFQAPAQQLQAAYPLLTPSLSLAEALCFKHSRRVAWDRTIKLPMARPANAARPPPTPLRRGTGGSPGVGRCLTPGSVTWLDNFPPARAAATGCPAGLPPVGAVPAGHPHLDQGVAVLDPPIP